MNDNHLKTIWCVWQLTSSNKLNVNKIIDVYISSDFQNEFGKLDLDLPCFSSAKVNNDLYDSASLQMTLFIGVLLTSPRMTIIIDK